jgi:hypothetical protein
MEVIASRRLACELKGGGAMELRFAQRARATTELDLEIEGNRAIRMQTLTAVFQLAVDDFTFRVKPRTRSMEQADTIRVEVAVQYADPGLANH